ncbi:MAG: Txe/YoeB family addiction module toxin [Rikenellaceae bacterium]
MIYQVEISDEAAENIQMHLKAGNTKLVAKISAFIDQLGEHPRSGTGKPERLKGYGDREMWSRHIDSKHRLTYEIKESQLIVTALSAYGHYGDK